MLPITSTPDPIALAGKRLDQMNSLRDMGHFPALVNAGATLNILVTLVLTRLVLSRYGGVALALPCWISVVLVLNLMPVVLLRAVRWRAGAPMPLVEKMNFTGDQHRFADWVYLAASANMAFWIMLVGAPTRCFPEPGPCRRCWPWRSCAPLRRYGCV